MHSKTVFKYELKIFWKKPSEELHKYLQFWRVTQVLTITHYLPTELACSNFRLLLSLDAPEL